MRVSVEKERCIEKEPSLISFEITGRDAAAQQLSEPPFGTIKRAMGHRCFLMKGLHKLGAEMSLTVLSYNLKRVINIIGVKKMIEAVTRRSLAASSRQPLPHHQNSLPRTISIASWPADQTNTKFTLHTP